MAKIYHDVTEIVGRTPLVRLNHLDEGLPGLPRYVQHCASGTP